jgi:hypothetical protein
VDQAGLLVAVDQVHALESDAEPSVRRAQNMQYSVAQKRWLPSNNWTIS